MGRFYRGDHAGRELITYHAVGLVLLEVVVEDGGKNPFTEALATEELPLIRRVIACVRFMLVT